MIIHKNYRRKTGERWRKNKDIPGLIDTACVAKKTVTCFMVQKTFLFFFSFCVWSGFRLEFGRILSNSLGKFAIVFISHYITYDQERAVFNVF